VAKSKLQTVAETGERPPALPAAAPERAWASRRADFLAVSALIALILLFLWPALLPGRVLLPLDIVVDFFPPWQQSNQAVKIHNLNLADAVTYIYPVKEFAADAVRRGEWPLWNPYVLAGYPFTYNTQAGLFYPLSLFYYLLPPATAVNAVILSQMILGALFMYLYLTQIGLKRLAAVAGSVLFIFNGMMVVWLEWQVVHAAVIWLPLQLYLAERMVGTITTPAAGGAITTPVGDHLSRAAVTIARPPAAVFYALLTGMALAVPWLGGHWNWTIYASMTLAAYLVWRLAPLMAQAPESLARARLAGLALLPLAVGVALSLVQVWPAAHYLSQSHRQVLPFSQSLSYGLLDRLVILLVPNFFGDPINQNWWGRANYTESTFYIGIMPLLLSGMVLWLRRDRFTLFFAGWGLLGFLWTLGTPLYGLLYALPIFGGLLPNRAATLFVFCVAVLSALSLDRLLETKLPGRRLAPVALLGPALLLLLVAGYFIWYRADVARTWPYLRPYTLLFMLLMAGSAVLLWLRLQGRLPATTFGLLVVAWLVADLFAFGYGYNTVSPAADLYPPTATTTFLQNEPGPVRIVTLPRGAALHPNTSLVARIANLSGYEPGILQRVLDFLSAAEGQSVLHSEREVIPFRSVDSPLVKMLGVNYIVTTDDRWREISTLALSQEQVDTWLELAPGRSVGQPLTVPDAGFHRLDLWLHAGDQLAGTVLARLATADGRQSLAHDTLDAAVIGAEGWYSFYFSAFPSDWGRDFLLTIEFDGVGGSLFVGAAAGNSAGAPLATVAEPAAGSLALAAYYLPRPNLVHEDGKTRIYHNEGHFQRAFVVSQALLAHSQEEALQAVLNHAQELDRVVILELEGHPPPPVAPVASKVEESTVTITAYNLNQVRLVANMAAPGFVVLADTYYPGWRATVGGQRTPVYRANYLLRAVYVPAGEHEILFYFRPPDFIMGAVISGLTLLGCCLVLAACWRRERGFTRSEGVSASGANLTHDS
jgi:hypothetical protein